MQQTFLYALAAGGAALALAAGVADAQTPKRGGTLNFSVVAEPPNYDCHGSTTFALIHPIAPHYSLLVKFDGKDYPKVVPDLAESWTVAPDGMTYTFKIRSGVKFHDGSPLTSQDIKASYERIIDPPQGVISIRKAYYSDLVVEASTQAHLSEIAPKTLKAGRDLVVLSCGALLRHQDWVELAEAKRCRIYVPSGAICGLDGIKGARAGAVTSVTLEMRKPPRGLAGAPYIEEKKIDLDAIREETLIFDGPATEACPAFPANVNILAALSLAGIGPELTRLKLYAVPGLTRNTHRVTAEGEFGRFTLEIANVPSDNPRTGKLSYLSTIALLRDLGSTLRVGT